MIENYMRSKDIMFKYALGKSVAQGVEIHPYHEILLFVGKKADFIADNIQTQINPDTIIIIPKGQYHRFNISDQNSYERYVLNFFDNAEIQVIVNEILTEISMLVSPPKHIIKLLGKLKECCDFSLCYKEQELLLKSALSLILLEIKLVKADRIVLLPNIKKTLISRAIEYIGTNYTKQITICDIAGELGVSNSNLAKCFKDEMGISIHRYIVEKRLVYAYEKISSGENPTKVCYMCGYTDYSSFYRAYKKMFKKSPSDI